MGEEISFYIFFLQCKVCFVDVLKFFYNFLTWLTISTQLECFPPKLSLSWTNALFQLKLNVRYQTVSNLILSVFIQNFPIFMSETLEKLTKNVACSILDYSLYSSIKILNKTLEIHLTCLPLPWWGYSTNAVHNLLNHI